jgi:hypothetical protein
MTLHTSSDIRECPAMTLALANLDNGLFFQKGHWTYHCGLADTFPDLEAVSRVAARHQIKNAAAAMVSAHSKRPFAFIWLSKPD